MFRPRLVIALLAVFAAVCVLAASGIAQDTKKEDPKPPVRLKGQLPQNYRALGLTEEQKQAVYKIQGEYDVKLADLEEQIKKVKAEEKKAIDKVLTDAQRARLKEILKEKSGIDSPASEKPAPPAKP